MKIKRKINKKSKLFSQKGFIGAIGDDLPSLIPIIVALLLFFTVFSLTLTSYNSKNLVLRKNMDLMSVSRDIKGDSLILNVDQFLERCELKKNQAQNYNYRIGIYSNEDLAKLREEDGRQVIDDFKDVDVGMDNFLSAENLDGDKETYFCEYIRLGGRELSNKKTDYLTRFYPVAVQKKETINDAEYYLIRPAVMVMVIWD